MRRTVLFVTYGGGHAAMAAPVIRALASYPIRTETLALTLAGPYFKRQGLPYKGFKDFLLPEDTEALDWGKKLAALHHHPETGIGEEEAIAYLGLSYRDLVTRLGEQEAARLWEEKGRNAFFPLSMLERVIDRAKPDMVVTTNSPRGEYAAQIAASKRGIPTLAMVDLFGLFNFYRIEADYVAVISPIVIDNMRRDTGLREGQKFLITGNPAFDPAFDCRGPVDHAWRRRFFPALPDHAKALLWIDDSGYVDKATGLLHVRGAEEIADNLDILADAARRNDGYLLIRPHPSQQRAPFDAWMRKTAHPHVMLAGEAPLYPLLNACDAVATFSSTVGCEALLTGRPVIQLGYYPGEFNMRLGDWGVARWAETPERLPEAVRQSFSGNMPEDMQARIAAMFPQEKAAPKIAKAIDDILYGREPSGVHAY
ncbi:MAG: hypothetical protein KGI29_09270 [Pseudomonadota bacterium]|nr:hypothetical protein [Pseudomonadota bacterium]MDE3038200.1 hypothetical protein [Pseudomonadota bacterium]